MNTKSSNRVLLLIIGVLLVTNFAMLLLYFLAPRERKFEGRFSRQDSGLVSTLREKVGFNESQIADYLKLRAEQRERTSQTFEGMTDVKERFYFTVFDKSTPDSLIEHIADTIAGKQKKVDLGMRNYFVRIRDLCTPEQQPAFDTVFRKVIYRMIGMPGMSRQPQQSKGKK
ncbi:MAG: hypothetical protein M9898_11970 [Chitinophagaceae bacterium]|nr:hypothetical protein [Chitinophagaceae bacterium]